MHSLHIQPVALASAVTRADNMAASQICCPDVTGCDQDDAERTTCRSLVTKMRASGETGGTAKVAKTTSKRFPLLHELLGSISWAFCGSVCVCVCVLVGVGERKRVLGNGRNVHCSSQAGGMGADYCVVAPHTLSFARVSGDCGPKRQTKHTLCMCVCARVRETPKSLHKHNAG